jgi:hypothetical protein
MPLTVLTVLRVLRVLRVLMVLRVLARDAILSRWRMLGVSASM